MGVCVEGDGIVNVIINVDDFALSPAIDAGVIDLAERGVVTSTSALVKSPRWPVAAHRLRDVPIDLGLHLDLTADASEDARASARFVVDALLRRLPTERIHCEVSDQLDRFEDAVGEPPRFVDGHLHLHQLPGVREVLIDELAVRYPHKMPAVRVCSAVRGAGVKAHIIAALGSRAFGRLARSAGIRTNGAFAGVYDFSQPVDLPLLWRRWLSNAPSEGLIVMSHVADPRVEADADAAIAHLDAREREYGWLASAAFQALMRELDCTPVRWPPRVTAPKPRTQG